MRIRFDEQLEQLNEEMINMGNMIEASIGNAVKALMKQDEELAKKTMAGDEKIDRTERKIEDLCLRLFIAAAAGSKRFKKYFFCIKNGNRYGTDRRSCHRYF